MYETTIDLGQVISNIGGYIAIIVTCALILLLSIKIITSQ